MGIFSKKKPVILSDLDLTEEDNNINFNVVLEYVIGLSIYDYNKLFKVSGIYRAANRDAAKALGVKSEPTTSIKEDITSNVNEDDGFNLDDDDNNTVFLEDSIKKSIGKIQG